MKKISFLFFIFTCIIASLSLASCGECDHEFGAWETTTAPTCSSDGERSRTCNICGALQRETEKSFGHKFSPGEIIKEATCTEDGLQTWVCLKDPTHTETRPISKTGHSFIDGVCEKCDEDEISAITWDVSRNESSSVTAKLRVSSNNLYRLVISGSGEIADFSAYNAPWEEYKEKITSLSIEEEITAIGKYAFFGLGAIESVTIPSSVNEIADSAFKDCTALKEIFFNATRMKDMTQAAFQSAGKASDGITVKIGKDVSLIPAYLFFASVSDTPNIIKVEFEKGCITKKIGAHAFQNLEFLKSIALPDGISEIGSYAFYNCKSITEIQLPSILEKIEEFAFYDCKSLTRITIPGGIKEVKESTFAGCSGLEELTLADGVEKIERQAFSACSSLVRVDLGNTLTHLMEMAFYKCTSLTDISLPTTLSSIDLSAFSECNVIKNVGGITYLDKWVISCDKYVINAINIKADTIGFFDGAFKNCVNMQSIYIPITVKYVNKDAFVDCVNLKTVYYGGLAYDYSQLALAEGNDPLAKAKICYYSEYDPQTGKRPYWHYVDGEITFWTGWSSFDSPIIPLCYSEQ